MSSRLLIIHLIELTCRKTVLASLLNQYYLQGGNTPSLLEVFWGGEKGHVDLRESLSLLNIMTALLKGCQEVQEILSKLMQQKSSFIIS